MQNEIPVIDISVSKSWVRLIRYCQMSFPHGELTIRIVNSEPTDLVDRKPKIRFDKEATIPKMFED